MERAVTRRTSEVKGVLSVGYAVLCFSMISPTFAEGDPGLIPLPVHPVFVHFPIALLTIVWALTAYSYWKGTDRFDESLGWAELVGVAFLPLVIGTGFFDAEGFEVLTKPEWDQPLIWHVFAALGASVVFGGHLWWRWKAVVQDPRKDVALTTLGMWLLVVAGLLAGEMVFS
jgi:uncharacterized membrane protein